MEDVPSSIHLDYQYIMKTNKAFVLWVFGITSTNPEDLIYSLIDMWI